MGWVKNPGATWQLELEDLAQMNPIFSLLSEALEFLLKAPIQCGVLCSHGRRAVFLYAVNIEHNDLS